MAEIIKVGAEATLYKIKWFGRDAVKKVRHPKKYRHPGLDKWLRSMRTRHEATLINQAKRLGVNTPTIFDINLAEGAIVMEYIRGDVVKNIVRMGDDRMEKICENIGRSIAVMHEGGLVHGDLTTSNMILRDDRVYFIDFGLGYHSINAEDFGVDLYLLKEVWLSTHSDKMHLYDKIIEAYASECSKADEVMKKLAEIEKRRRYV
ncbi:MAG: Kae1-associated kinase Bud32 [Thermoplasmata archaeon]|nr:MAG: Kae1-associated kinase Bud32 [Thermoplasmata archaeon]